jgi:hypothetical protein
MSTGLSILHRLDSTITKARTRASEAAELSRRAGDALLDLQRSQAKAYSQIARDRLEIIEDGDGGDLGYVDRQAAKLLQDHEGALEAAQGKVEASLKEIEDLETQRRKQEVLTAKAIDGYDKAAAKAEADLLKDAAYNAQVDKVEHLESTVARAEEKLAIAQADEQSKGETYRNDSFFSYLQNRRYGTKEAKGWFLTKWLDGGVARLAGYRQAAENYRRLTAIPVRLASHVENLQGDVVGAQNALQKMEADWLVSQGVSDKRKASLEAQRKLEAIDDSLAKAEEIHASLIAEHSALAAGETGPYKDAVNLVSDILSRQNIAKLRRLAAQTRSREDDAAVEAVKELSRAQDDLLADQREAKNLLSKYQSTLNDLQAVRQNFKARRYDAPSSSFKRADLIAAVMTQVLAGERAGKDLWKQITRNQRTNKRYSDTDFGGIDWTEGLRLPRQTRGYGRRGSGIDIGDVFGVLEGIARSSGGGSYGGRSGGWDTRAPTRRRTSIPRRPRQSLPKVRLPRSGGGGFGGGRRGGGFKTGGGF